MRIKEIKKKVVMYCYEIRRFNLTEYDVLEIHDDVKLESIKQLTHEEIINRADWVGKDKRCLIINDYKVEYLFTMSIDDFMSNAIKTATKIIE